MKTHLTTKEHLEFKRIDKILRLRKNSSSLILLGADSKILSNELLNYFSVKDGICEYIPKSINIILDLVQKEQTKISVINLYNHKDIDKILKNLQFTRDFIPEYKLKLIFIFDKDSLEKLIETCFDFYSTNSFSYQFTDHSYTFDKSQIKQNDKLDSAIAKYKVYTTMQNTPQPKIVVEMLLNVANEAYSISKLKVALEYYEKALDIAQKNMFRFEESAILGNIGLIYSDKGDLDNARKYYKESLAIFKEIGYPQGIKMIENNLLKLKA